MSTHNILKAFVGITLLMLSASLTAQDLSIDSLETLLSKTSDPIKRGIYLVDLADAYQQIDLKAMKRYIDQAADIPAYAARQDKALKLKYMYGSLADRENRFDTATLLFEEIIENQTPKITDSIVFANSHYKLGNIGRRQGKTDEAIEHLLQAKEIRLAMGSPMRAASADIVLGIIYKNTGFYDEALEYYQSAYEVYKSKDMVNNMATCILNIANVRTRQNKYEIALEKYQEALTLSEGLDEGDNLKAYVFGNMSNLYSQMHNPSLALEYAKRSYALRKISASPEERANSLIGMSLNLNELGRYNEALNKLDQASEAIADTEGLISVWSRIYEFQYKINRSRDRPREALKSVAKFIQYSDSLRKTDLKKQAFELNTKYETERKDKEIILLNAENELQTSKLSAARRQLYILLSGFVIVGGLLFTVFRLFRKTKSQNTLIQKALNEKDILLREIHHRVKNNLQFISSLLGLQTEHIQDPSLLGVLQEGQDRVQSMALIHQNLYQEDNLTGVNIRDYFIKLIRGLFDSYNIRKGDINLELEIKDLNLDVDTVVPIGLIVNELVSNSLKYAFPGSKGTIYVLLAEENDKLILRVRDDGRGVSKEEIAALGSSFGYRLIHVFKDQLHAELFIDGREGMLVEMRIGKYEKVD